MNIKPIRIGIMLCLVTILFGYILGGAFGAANSTIKGYFHQQVYVTHAQNFTSEQDKVTAYNKAKAYIKRAHLHSGAIGSAALVTILALGFCGVSERKKKLTSIMIGFGASGYGVFVWTLMALMTPMIGKSAAHELVAVLAIPTGLALVVGTIVTMIFVMVDDK
ncbi:hypothetical protein ACFOD0_16780 [Shewanella intestini]|uniref:DUF423 domain-containing protein n=1 Tax=Shewanella intestini TaxID=2017544 RepID=A0ABS5I534_9GAMM|nr:MULTISPECIES: hypothetical protein [Shewanella]MBR9729147.1 hypothetical protein [Shewanella intestini]MRG37282.1 hypothetical protein [Shewanella sp. XMDDZSB0408]